MMTKRWGQVPDVRVAVLGDLEVRVDDRVVTVTRPRLRTLLCALALRAGRSVPLLELAEQVWQDQVPDRYRPGLHTLVNQLRNLIGTDVIQTVPGGYLLDVQPNAVDALAFQRMLDSVRDFDNPMAARPVLAAALRLWRSDELITYMRPESVTHLVERYLTAVQQRVDIDLQLGMNGELVAELRDLTARFPLREPLWARLITAQYRAGRFAEALDTYQAVREQLADMLGTDPSAELRGLYSLVLSAQANEPVMTSGSVPHQLPPAHGGFVGRQAEQDTLVDLVNRVRPGRPPVIVAMHGPAGAGKTALAVHWAHEVSTRFPDGTVYVDMHGFGPGEPLNPGAALTRMLAAVGVSRIPSTVEEKAALWRTLLHDRRMLLVIDNVRDAEQACPLLPGRGGVVVLVTSRNDLRGLVTRSGAHSLRVGEFDLAEAAELGATAALAEVCGRLPLALVVAAHLTARFPQVPVESFVDELRAGNPLDLLAEPTDPTVDLRSVLSWSYRALDVVTAAGFRALAYHPPGDITPAGAARWLREPVDSTRRLLDALASVHLLERVGRGYRFNTLIRQYAQERATAETLPQLVAVGQRATVS
jgi:DNA-binding SARP family transcriptional activator